MLLESSTLHYAHPGQAAIAFPPINLNTGEALLVLGKSGSGKTTLLNALGAQGMNVMPEAGRAIIQAQSAIDGPGVPWGDCSGM